jgi:riboflavin synthase
MPWQDADRLQLRFYFTHKTMFSGIIAATGKIIRIDPREKGVSLLIDAGSLDLGDVVVGDSIACSGVCLTVIARQGNSFSVDVSRETLDCTVGLDQPGELNLEKALRLSDRLGGHLVSGHVDGVGEVIKFEQIGESHELVTRAPQALAKYIARKGSVCVDGVSLTTNAVTGAEFSINLIPHTVAVTTLKRLKPGSRVNLEVDLIARYVERMLTADTAT